MISVQLVHAAESDAAAAFKLNAALPERGKASYPRQS
jgi:hypothetical protein